MRILLSLALALALTALPANAAECVPTTRPSPELDTDETALGRYYGDNDCPESGAQPPNDYCMFYPVAGWWIYEESNGIDGLQRRDEVVDDTCNGQIQSDTLIF